MWLIDSKTEHIAQKQFCISDNTMSSKQIELNVEQTYRHLQQRFKEHIGNKEPTKTHFENCKITPTDDMISISGRMDRGDGRLLTLEALFIKEIAYVLNTNDGYRSRAMTLKF